MDGAGLTMKDNIAAKRRELRRDDQYQWIVIATVGSALAKPASICRNEREDGDGTRASISPANQKRLSPFKEAC